jgi:hypothetical protein
VIRLQLEMDLHTAQKEDGKLKQQNIELSLSAWSLRDRAERSSQVLDEYQRKLGPQSRK